MPDSGKKNTARRSTKKSTDYTPLIIGAAVVVLLAIFIAAAIASNNKNNSDDTGTFNIKATYYADIEIKDYGTITVALDSGAAPITVKNFVGLARSGFYDGLTFHRIMSGFMMQGGDPNGNGSGGSGKNIKGEFKRNGVDNPISHKRGVISMARRSDSYDSASSQFFIIHQDYPSLDGQYAAFGVVTEGMDIVDKICADARPIDNNGTIPADQQPVIVSVTIREAE